MKKVSNNFSKYLFLMAGLTLTLVYSCSVKKYIPQDEYLFRGGNIKIQDTVKNKDIKGLEKELKSLIYPKPNIKILGLYPGLYYYFKAQGEKPGFIARYLNKKIGEEPAYLSDFQIESTEDLLENRLENSGFFQNDISSQIKKDSSSKTSEATFTVVIGKPYRLLNYTIEVDSAEKLFSFPIYQQLENSLSETILNKGCRYDLSAFKAERDRIDKYMKERGYYNFNSSFILFQADTNLNNNRNYNLYLKLKVGVPEKSKVPYVLDNVEVFVNSINDTSGVPLDTVTINGVDYIQKELFFVPKRLHHFVLLQPGQLYDPLSSKYTSQRISSIGTYKFVNIQYQETDSTNIDSLNLRHLNATITLSPLTKKSIRAELQGVTKSNSFTGPNLSVTYLNRNVFKGGEIFSIAGNLGYEKQFSRNTNGSSSLRMGSNFSLIYPRLVFLGKLDKYFKYSVPKTKLSANLDYLRRSQLYSINSYSATFGYFWNANRYVTHQIDPISLNYVSIGKRSAIFDSILDKNPFLKRSFEQQFIEGLVYSFIYNELSNFQKKGRFYIKLNMEFAGNKLSLISRNQDSDSTKTFLGLKYAQFAKSDLDLSYHYKLDKRGNTLVGRIFGGIGIPYGNSKTLPYVKQYFAGGSYSVRAFRIRGLGPGTYNPVDETNLYFDRSGDIRLEGNLEYRFPIISVLKGALFADAGNIWNLNDNLPGGKFTSDFIYQFGVGAGFGLRVDVQGFVIRLDLSAPIKRPYSNWYFEYDKPVLNFAIGYPF